MLSDLHVPTVLIGEVKSHQTIDTDDIDKLEWIQSVLLAKNIECFTLIATLNDSYSPQEVELLRASCERAPELRRSSYTVGTEPLALPIVLTSRQLSADQFSDDHPFKFATPGGGLLSVAIESCKQNLGLKEIGRVPSDEGFKFTLVWNEATIHDDSPGHAGA